MHTPEVSVVMACYNVDKTVSRAIESILSQTEPDFEFIIVDDASQDKTASILADYQQIDNRIQLLHNPINKGLAHSLNRAIRQAKAPFIARMDADDISFPERLSRQLAHLEANPHIDVLGTATHLMDNTAQVIGTVVLPAEHEQIVNQRYLRPLFIHPSVVFRRTFFDRCGYYDERLQRTEDLDLWLRGRNKAVYSNLPDVLFCYLYKHKINFSIFKSDMFARWRHMYTSGELLKKGHELLWYSIRYLLLTYTGYTSKSIRSPPKKS